MIKIELLGAHNWIFIMSNYLSPRNSNAYIIAFELSNYVWAVVENWDYFKKRTVGAQFVNAVDSISANISEGFGRFFKKDKINFYRFARGSAFEANDWNEKAYARKLIDRNQYAHINNELSKLPLEINILIKTTNDKLRM